jgi:cell volume regulation protein A
MARIEEADMIFNIVFFIALTSVLIQGTSIPVIAKWLHVSLPARVKAVTPSDILLSESFNSALAEITITPDNYAAGMKIIDLGFPQNARIALLKRNDKNLIPDGLTEIKAGDQLLVIAANKEILASVSECLSGTKPAVSAGKKG